jgi:maltooligosyltrehalose trehalohydrolase
LSQQVSFAAQKLAAGLVLLSPFVPLLFMGEEYGEISPFLYFTDHSDRDLVEAVRNGRRIEFKDFGWRQEVPDPQDPKTFEESKLLGVETEQQQTLRRFYQALITFRRQNELGANAEWKIEENEEQKVLRLTRTRNSVTTTILCNFGDELVEEPTDGTAPGDADPLVEEWRVEIWSSDRAWLGCGMTPLDDLKQPGNVKLAPLSFTVLQRGTMRVH